MKRLIVLLLMSVMLMGCGAQDVSQATGNTVEIELDARNWEFSPQKITVKKGDLVKVTVTSEDVPHGIALPEFGVNEHFNANTPGKFEFIADKLGSFTFFCSVPCGRGHGQMRGTLVVE